MNVCREKMPEDNLLIQKNHDAMGELIEAFSLPFFNSDRMMERGYMPSDRIAVPISDSQANVSYYIACLSEEKKKFEDLFSNISGNIIKGIEAF